MADQDKQVEEVEGLIVAQEQEAEKIRDEMEALKNMEASFKERVEFLIVAQEQETEKIRDDISQLQAKIVSSININYVQELQDIKKELDENKKLDMMQTRYEIGNLTQYS